MRSVQLGATELRVSHMGLGTMTFGAATCAHCSLRTQQADMRRSGERNTYEESARLLSMAGTRFCRTHC